MRIKEARRLANANAARHVHDSAIDIGVELRFYEHFYAEARDRAERHLHELRGQLEALTRQRDELMATAIDCGAETAEFPWLGETGGAR